MEKNYSTTISIKDLKNIGREKYEELKKEAFPAYRKFYDSTFLPTATSSEALYVNYYILKRYKPSYCLKDNAIDFAFKKSINKDKDETSKWILAANFAFRDNNKFIEILLNNNYHLSDLINFAKFFENMNLNLENLKINDTNEKRQLKNLKNISEIMKLQYGINDYQLIITKMIEIYVFQRGLYTKKELQIRKEKIISDENSLLKEQTNKKVLAKTR